MPGSAVTALAAIIETLLHIHLLPQKRAHYLAHDESIANALRKGRRIASRGFADRAAPRRRARKVKERARYVTWHFRRVPEEEG